MPDKRNDEQFMDEAWEQMRVMLDREMPEERKRRLVPVFWLLSAAASLLLLLTVSIVLWQQKSPQMPIAVVENTANTAPITTVEHCEETSRSEVLVQNDAKKQSTISHHNHSASLEKNDVNTIDSKRNKQKSLNAETLAGFSIHKNKEAYETLAQAFESSTIPLQNSEIIDNKNITIITPLAAIDVAMLKYQRPSDLVNQSLKTDLWLPEEADKKSNHQNFKIGLEFATYSSAYAAVDGYAGGAVVDIPVQSKSLNLRAGVNFSAQQRYFDSNIPAGAGKSADPNISNNPGFGTSSNVVVDPNPELSVNAQQISLPLTLQFKPRRTWGLEGGLQASYLLNAQNLKGAEAYQTLTGMAYGSQKVRTLVDGFSLDSSAGSSSDKINLEQLRRFDVALTAGFGYYPTSSIGVRLQYQRGLIDMLKPTDFKAFGNNIRLSAVYFFGK